MYSQITANKRKSFLIIAFFIMLASALAWFLGYYLDGNNIVSIAIVFFALVYALYSYFNAAKMAVAMQKAKQVTEAEEPRLYRTVENLAITEGMPMPKVYVIEDDALNAFATGRDPAHAVVAATRGLLNTLEDSELEGVMAHELGHVKNLDIRVSMLAFALISVVAIISDVLLRSMWFGGGNRRDNNNAGSALALIAIVFAILAPISAKLLQLAVSRQREYLADATGAMTTRYPEALASALEKIATNGSRLQVQNSATAHLFIANPLKTDKIKKWFSTHPPVEDRIARLRQMGSKL